jgi:diphosphomevalonate decarboxylase
MPLPERPRPRAVTARAGTNIALVKYWGKRDPALNLPATGSLSLTLDGLGSETRVRFAPDAGDSDGADSVLLGGVAAEPRFAKRVRAFLDLVRERAGLRLPAEVATTNTVPTAAGLASSASGFAALALAASRAAGLALPAAELSVLARRGSGSAARSIFGGFVEMAAGQDRDGSDAHARPLLDPESWDVRLVVALTTRAQKPIGSTAAMERTAATSPYYPAWIAATERDLPEARAAVAARDLARLGAIAERSALRMHASAMAAEPAILYWNATTVAAMRAVLELRETGTPVYFTIDAGPHVKALCAAADAAAVERALGQVPGVERTLVAAPGPGAAVIEVEEPT